MDELNLKQIESLLCQSLNGIHLLFENHKVAEVLKIPTEDIDFFSDPNLDKIQQLFHDLISKQSFIEKQEYLHSLDPESFEVLLRTYFHILDNTAQISSNFKH